MGVHHKFDDDALMGAVHRVPQAPSRRPAAAAERAAVEGGDAGGDARLCHGGARGVHAASRVVERLDSEPSVSTSSSRRSTRCRRRARARPARRAPRPPRPRRAQPAQPRGAPYRGLGTGQCSTTAAARSSSSGLPTSSPALTGMPWRARRARRRRRRRRQEARRALDASCCARAASTATARRPPSAQPVDRAVEAPRAQVNVEVGEIDLCSSRASPEVRVVTPRHRRRRGAEIRARPEVQPDLADESEVDTNFRN